MSDFFCKQCGKYHASLTVCPNWAPGVTYLTPVHEAPDPWPLVREPVRWFAGEMERQLRHNDNKTGWGHLRKDRLLVYLAGEIGELALAASPEDIIHEAADVANFAMMIADNTRATAALKRREGVGRG